MPRLPVVGRAHHGDQVVGQVVGLVHRVERHRTLDRLLAGATEEDPVGIARGGDHAPVLHPKRLRHPREGHAHRGGIGHVAGQRQRRAADRLGFLPRCGVCPLAGECPSRGSRYEPLRRQSRFDGSFRQRRANALRAVVAGDRPEDAEAVDALARDGLVTLRDGTVTLPA